MGRKYLANRAAGILSTHTSRSERRDILTQLWHDVSIGTQMQRITDGRYEYHGAAATPLDALLERARATFTEHDAQYPDRADTQYHLAVCLDALDEHADASVRVNLALRINPRYASAQRLAMKICQA